MGSPLSPVISNLYMEYFETVIIKDIKPPGMIWLRYVDDILTTWNPAWGDFDNFFNRLNNLVPSINFKVEWEKYFKWATQKKSGPPSWTFIIKELRNGYPRNQWVTCLRKISTTKNVPQPDKKRRKLGKSGGKI